MNIHTACIHAGYKAKNGEPRCLPIMLSTTFRYESTETIADLFNHPERGFMYSRISNPTCSAVEEKIAALEGGVAAMLTSSGQMAILLSVLNLCKAGDHCVVSSAIYGGTVNLFSTTLPRFGITATFVSPHASKAQIKEAVQPNTKLVYGETLANPALNVLDIETFAQAAHESGLPLIVDNTFPTPVLCKPFEWGADIVVHSTSKYMDGHAISVGGVIIDSGRFDWAHADRFPDFNEPDESYHGVIYTRDYGKLAYMLKLRMQLERDFGVYPPATSAFILNETLETLPLRMAQHCKNAQILAEWLSQQEDVDIVSYPRLKDSSEYALAQKYLPKGASGVVSFVVRDPNGAKGGSRTCAAKLLDSFKLVAQEVHVADSQSSALHPASSTHRQLSDQQLLDCGVLPGSIRLSCGLEDAADILADLEQAFKKL